MEKRRALQLAGIVILLLLQLVEMGSGDVESACKKAGDAKFCASLLQPYASELSDGVKTGLAAVNATLKRVDELRELMVHEAVREQTTPEELQALTRCLSNVGNGEGALDVALQTLRDTNGVDREEVSRMIGAAATELTACADSLKKHTADPVITKALAFTEDSLEACSLSQALLP